MIGLLLLKCKKNRSESSERVRGTLNYNVFIQCLTRRLFVCEFIQILLCPSSHHATDFTLATLNKTEQVPMNTARPPTVSLLPHSGKRMIANSASLLEKQHYNINIPSVYQTEVGGDKVTDEHNCWVVLVSCSMYVCNWVFDASGKIAYKTN